MGRQKNVPVKNTKGSEYWSLHSNNFIPVIKKRRTQRKSSKSISVLSPNEENKKFHLGSVFIGTTNNVFPSSQYNKCKIAFNPPVEDGEPHTAVVEYDGSFILIKLTFDADFFKEICTMKFLALRFTTKNEDVFMDIFLQSLPIPRFYSRLGNCIKALFQLMYNIGMETADDAAYAKCDKTLHGNTEIFNLYNQISAVRDDKFTAPDSKEIEHPFLRPKLRPYQQQAVRWMLHREAMIGDKIDELHPLYTTVVLKSGLTVYYNKYTGYLDIEKPVVPPCSKGGILADEMGLGKTVEVLACILLNRKPFFNESHTENTLIFDNDVDSVEDVDIPVIHKQPKKRKRIQEDCHVNENVDHPKKLKVPNDWVKSSSKKTPTKIALEMWYNSMLSEMSVSTSSYPYRNDDEPLVQCICGSTSEEGIIECDSCGKYQHRLCLGYNKALGRYLCPQCWMDEPLLDCGGTLIVTPMSLRTQWCNEICRHIKGGLRVLQYEGYSATPVYPTKLKEYDLVITTYNVLKAELRLTECGQTINLRRERKYSPPCSPLVLVKWWRLCLDEAQTVETPGRMVSEMARKISATLRWAITGTPISKEISDLQGLVDYLQMTPFDDITTWHHILYEPYIKGDTRPMLDFLSKVLWRTSKKDVLDQINIPNQAYKEHFLEFSAVEKYFYRREHELSCNDFLARVLAPLLTLRHACTHPNTLRGRYLATKKQVTSMKDLLDALILKNTSDSEECLRLVIASLNGLAGIHLLMQGPQQAINYYREVLQLAARFSEGNKEAKLTVDKLQVIHTMYNLAQILDTCQPSEPTLRDGTLRRDCAELEEKYIEKFRKETVSAYETSNSATLHIEALQEKFVLKDGQWYSDGLDWTFINNFYGDLLERIQNACDNANIECNLRSSSERSIMKLIFTWDEDVFYFRDLLSESMNQLYHVEPETSYKIVVSNKIVEQATNCHLRPQKKSKNASKCLLCLCNVNLKRYEAKLFNMTERKKSFEEMSLVGSWKPTLEEVIMRSLLNLLKARNGNSDHIKDGEVHINLIEGLKKEFKEVRRLWTLLDRQVCAGDELDICKVRLQLRDLTYTLEDKNENVNLISVYELQYQNSLLNSELKVNRKKLEKSLGTQSYLETLRKQQYEGQSPDPCPICKNSLENHWSILLCGHSYCLECIQLLLEKNVGEHIQCSVCRNRQRYQEISYIKAGNTVTNEDCVKIRGNYSTKIEAVIKLLLDLKNENQNVKVLVFSSWLSVLKCLRGAIEKNGITCEIALNSKLETRIENFKDDKKKITAFLLPVALGSKGLNLIEATHVILVEPLLNPADELQAIGRVHRIGQSKPTTVHKFLIKDTIEESIHQATTSNADSWDRNKVTLHQLTQLFVSGDGVLDESSDMENSQNVSSEDLSEVSASFPINGVLPPANPMDDGEIASCSTSTA
ncbi:hypothetical protein NQ315_002994 [Exocentrus adspersus]|uniref:E3 ubiquitin-protein ligase SHPRH n=1 Tax=Exocentrus adspersus TaxID=1586481 RepID=A0AAV8W4L5_9CUCU|nr:hypothetical protein NQ315_002994 [Exocentrus adspersus]